jgi:hypothetical protein
VLKNTHVNVEISPEDIPAAALDGVAGSYPARLADQQ